MRRGLSLIIYLLGMGLIAIVGMQLVIMIVALFFGIIIISYYIVI